MIQSHDILSKIVIIETDEYNLTVDWSSAGWVDYRIKPNFTEDFVRYRRVNPQMLGQGTVDEYGHPMDDVNMTITSWGIRGNCAWFLESSPEFSLNQTFMFFRDYMELNVTYSPGTKNVLTTYFVALYSEAGEMYSMFDGGYHRYVPGFNEENPESHGMGGWYPTYLMFAPALDMRVPHGNMGVEWGYSDTVAYLWSPIWMADYGYDGPSAFSLKYSSLNSVVPNIGLGIPKTFHMFVRPYYYDDGKDRGYDVGYAQWVAYEIVRDWGYYKTPMFPLAIMSTGAWSTEFRQWVESSSVKVATYTHNPDQISWNYGSAWRLNRDPADDPSLIPDDWELWGPGNLPQYTGTGAVILNPVSGTYENASSFRYHLIEDSPYNDWWWSSDAVFWDEMNTYTPDVKPRNDYHNRSEFIYDGYLRLVKESHESGHWNFTIANPYTALLHLGILSDLTVIESYRSSSFFGVDFVDHAHSTMRFVNNIPEQYRPNILVYQYYNAKENPEDQEDVYRLLFGSARYGFSVAPVSWSNDSYQIHNLEMAEKMYSALGASRDKGIQVQAETLDLDLEGSAVTDSRTIVWVGNGFTPNIELTNQEKRYNFTNLHGVKTDFGASINTTSYYLPDSSEIKGSMTFFSGDEAWFNGSLEAEETCSIARIDTFQVHHSGAGRVIVRVVELSKMTTDFDVATAGGNTDFTIGGLQPETRYSLILDGTKYDVLVSDSSGWVTFTLPFEGQRRVSLMIGIINDLRVIPVDLAILGFAILSMTFITMASVAVFCWFHGEAKSSQLETASTGSPTKVPSRRPRIRETR
jgi:hypothetical protein